MRSLQKSVTLTKNDKFVRKLRKAKIAYQIRYDDKIFAICSRIGHFAVVNWPLKRSHIFTIMTFLVATFILAPTALASYSIPGEYQPGNIAESWVEQNSEDMGDTESYGALAVTFILADLVSGLLGITGVIAVYFLVSNGFQYSISFGQQDKIDKAKKGITWSIVGIFVIMLSYAIVRFVIKIVLTTDSSQFQDAGSGATAEAAHIIMSLIG